MLYRETACKAQYHATLIASTWDSDGQQLLKAILLVQELLGRCTWSKWNTVSAFLANFDKISNTLRDSLLDLLNGVACH